MSQGVSLALSTMFTSQARQTALATNTLLDFTLSQRGLLKTGFMNQVKFVSSDNVNTQEPDKSQGYFDLRNIAIFGDNKYMCMLTDEEIRGFALLNNDVTGSSFVTDVDGKQLTVTINSKDIKFDLQQGNVIKCEINLQGREAHTDSGEVEGQFVAQNKKELPQAAIDDIIAQATAQINSLLDKQRQYNFDIVNLHETIRRRDGTSEQLNNLPTADIDVEAVVTFNEK